MTTAATFIVSFPASSPLDAKVGAINLVRSLAGERPVPGLDTNGASAAAEIERIIDRHDERIQSRGWFFNWMRHIKLTPDTVTKLIAVPADAIFLDPERDAEHRDIVARNGYLYDVTNNLSTFDGDVVVRYVKRVPFAELPFEFSRWIAHEAAVEYLVHHGRDRNLLQIAETHRQRSQREAVHLNNRRSDANVFDSRLNRTVRGEIPFGGN